VPHTGGQQQLFGTHVNCAASCKHTADKASVILRERRPPAVCQNQTLHITRPGKGIELLKAPMRRAAMLNELKTPAAQSNTPNRRASRSNPGGAGATLAHLGNRCHALTLGEQTTLTWVDSHVARDGTSSTSEFRPSRLPILFHCYWTLPLLC